MFKILVVEDDKDLNKAVCTFLNNNGFECIGCLDVQGAYNAMDTNAFDMIISDIMIPHIDGFEFAESIRAVDKVIPIIFMTAKDDIVSKQKGFRMGIDDYMVKPIDLDELLLRIGAILRRTKIAHTNRIEIGDFVMDNTERSVYLGSEEIPLTQREFDILYKLLSYPKKTFTRAMLMEEFWDMDSLSSSRNVDVYMTKLRSKLTNCDGFELVTVHGLGYKAVLK